MRAVRFSGTRAAVSVMGVALALPFTYKMDVTASIVLLTAM